MGKVDDYSSDTYANTAMMLFQHSHGQNNNIPNVERFWSLEDIGIKENPYQSDDDKALQIFNKTIRSTDDGRYEVTWPWKDANVELPDNFQLALGRLKSLLKRIGNQAEVMVQYQKTIDDQLSNGIIEKVSLTGSDMRTHYMPHHCVIRNNKATTKLRVVYDASAKCNKSLPSLNECLLRGPVILQDLCGMILRFRLGKLAICSDVEKAFLQVGLQEQERDVTRFLWLKDVTKPADASNLLVFRFCRVPFGIISSPFLLSATIKHHCIKLNTGASTDIANNIYVDNVLATRDSIEDAKKYYDESKQIFKGMLMNIREWYTNCKELTEVLPTADKGVDEIPKLLGLNWNIHEDTISCQGIKDCVANTGITKRVILQMLSTVYDPIGYFNPVTIRGKMLVQQLWKDKIHWDDKVSVSVSNDFKELKCELKELGNVKLCRRINEFATMQDTSNELHCFADASKKAYAAVVYMKSKTETGKTCCSIVMAKTRLSPIKEISLPRLELMACIVGVRLLTFVERELRIPLARKVLWSDSKCVLHWIHSTRMLSVFVRNRINEIKAHNSITCRYVPTACNPADIPSRGCSLIQLQESIMWWTGPSFLMTSEGLWPENEFENGLNEKLVVSEADETKTVMLLQVDQEKQGIQNIISPNKYSNFLKLIRVTAYVLRFISMLKNKSETKTYNDSMVHAQDVWILSAQKESENECSGKKNKKMQKLCAFKHQKGITRCRGRAEIFSEETDYPILLPKKNTLTQLIIAQCHEKLFHAGARQTLSEVRLKYWITHGMSQVQKVIRKCRICRRHQGGPCKVPEMPPLPYFRRTECHPFEFTGLEKESKN